MTCFSLLCRTCELPQLQMFVSNSFEAALELSLGSGLAEVCVVGGGGGRSQQPWSLKAQHPAVEFCLWVFQQDPSRSCPVQMISFKEMLLGSAFSDSRFFGLLFKLNQHFQIHMEDVQ